MTMDKSLSKLYNELQAMNIREVCFTSSITGEGVTTIVQLLAQNIASFKHKTVIVDCCYEGQHAFVDRALISIPKVDSAIIANVNFYQESEYLYHCSLGDLGKGSIGSKEKLQKLLIELKSKFHYVFIDSPALTSHNHVVTEILTEMSQATVLVVLAGVLTSTRLKDTVVKIVRSGANLIGSVVNDVENPQLVDELCRETYRLEKVAPKKMQKLRKWLRKNQLLNLEL